LSYEFASNEDDDVPKRFSVFENLALPGSGKYFVAWESPNRNHSSPSYVNE
jgi:hypothetical protein